MRLVVAFPPGGGADNLVRAVAPAAQKFLGQPLVIDNRPGAGGSVGVESVARSAPDGYTITHGTNGTHGINLFLYSRIAYDPIVDFAPVTRFTIVPAMLVIHPSLPASSVTELLAYLKANPGKVSFSSSGNGTTSHMAAVMFMKLAGVEMVHIPYKGGGPALAGILAGDVQLNIDLMAVTFPNVKAGRLKGLAVTTAHRVAVAPDTPTLDESGVKGFEIAATDGIYAPAGTPRPIIDRLNAAFVQALNDPEVRERLLSRGSVPSPSTPEELTRHIASELPKWRDLVRASGAKVD